MAFEKKVSIAIIGKTDQFVKSLTKGQKALQGLGSVAAGIGKAAAVGIGAIGVAAGTVGKELVDLAKTRLENLNISNVIILLQDGFFGYAPQAPFDRIIITAAVEEIPNLVVSQLKVGGVMIAPVGLPNQKQTLLKVIKTEKGLDIKELMSVRFVQMKEGLVKI